MKMKDGVPYRLLPGTSRRIGFLNPARHCLWLTPDHLLHLRISYYSETSKRFYLKDIQAITVSKTNQGRNESIILGIMALLFGIVALGTYLEEPSMATVLVSIISFAFLGVMFVSLISGSTCKCNLYTAVHEEELPSLRYLRTAKKVLGMLKPLIEAAQGSLPAEELGADSPGIIEVEPATHAGPGGIVKTKVAFPGQLRHESGASHMALFSLLILKAISSALGLFYQFGLKNPIDMLLIIAILVLATIALRSQRHSDLPGTLKALTFIGLYATVIFYFVGLFYGVFSYPVYYPGPEFVIFSILAAAICSVTGIMGIIRLDKFRSEHKAPRAVEGAGVL